jgi:hypothetical protein
VELSDKFVQMLKEPPHTSWDIKWKLLLLEFEKTPTEENAYKICRVADHTIEVIKNPTTAVENYNKLYWS